MSPDAIELTLSPMYQSEPVFSILYYTISPGIPSSPTFTVLVYFGSTGDDPAAGYPPNPTIGPIEHIPGPVPQTQGTSNWAGFRVLGSGTVNLSVSTSVAGVPIAGDIAILSIKVNGTTVGSDSIGPAANNYSWNPYENRLEVTVSDVPVNAGDEIRVYFASPGGREFFLPMFGAAGNFELTGSLVPE